MTNELPAYAKEWAMQWKRAAPALQAIRDQELRQVGGAASAQVCGHRVFDRYPEKHGMVTMQRWFTRRALLEQQLQSEEVDHR